MELNFIPNNLPFQEQSRGDQNLIKTQSASAGRIAQSESKKTELKLTTKEGDIVTLRAASAYDSEMTTYSAFKKTNDSAASMAGFSANINYSSSYEISLEGDFSKEELRDINKAISKLEKSMKHLSRGNMDKAVDNAVSISGLDTIGGFEANLRYSATKQYDYIEKSTFQRPDTSDKSKADTKISDNSKSLLQRLTDELADTAKNTEVPKDNVLSTINRLFEDMKAQMEERNKENKNPWDNFLDNLKNRFEKRLFS
ncbi:MAG: hypothetical protein RBR53_04420 [Desulforegulaceae bacterium]|nr:hypothetical protein [Desulforegulaceae bacterium]